MLQIPKGFLSGPVMPKVVATRRASPWVRSWIPRGFPCPPTIISCSKRRSICSSCSWCLLFSWAWFLCSSFCRRRSSRSSWRLQRGRGTEKCRVRQGRREGMGREGHRHKQSISAGSGSSTSVPQHPALALSTGRREIPAA